MTTTHNPAHAAPGSQPEPASTLAPYLRYTDHTAPGADAWSDWPDEPETCTVWEYLITWACIPLLGITTIAVIAGVAGYLWALF